MNIFSITFFDNDIIKNERFPRDNFRNGYSSVTSAQSLIEHIRRLLAVLSHGREVVTIFVRFSLCTPIHLAFRGHRSDERCITLSLFHAFTTIFHRVIKLTCYWQCILRQHSTSCIVAFSFAEIESEML